MIGSKVHRLKEAVSTNGAAFDLAKKCAAEGEIVIADVQTKGRGRAGRSWESSSKNNIYMSVVLRPARFSDMACITLVAGISVAESLLPYARGELKIKWPNDLWLNGKKLCGILAEKGDGFVVVGMGVNVNSRADEFSTEVGNIATSLYIESGNRFSIEDLVASICERFDANYAKFQKDGFVPFKGTFDKWSLANGRRVSVSFAKDVSFGIAIGVDDDGALLLDNDGKIERVVAGDVKICS